MIIKDALGHTAEVPWTVMLMVPTWWRMSTTLTTMQPMHATEATPILKRL